MVLDCVGYVAKGEVCEGEEEAEEALLGGPATGVLEWELEGQKETREKTPGEGK